MASKVSFSEEAKAHSESSFSSESSQEEGICTLMFDADPNQCDITDVLQVFKSNQIEVPKDKISTRTKGSSIQYMVTIEAAGHCDWKKLQTDLYELGIPKLLKMVDENPNKKSGYAQPGDAEKAQQAKQNKKKRSKKFQAEAKRRFSTLPTSEKLITDHQHAHWFPIHISDLDRFADRVLSYGSELDSDHPGFTDEVYRKRRKQFADIAIQYRYNDPVIPYVEYTAEERATWNAMYTKLTTLFKTHACKEFNQAFPELAEQCGYSADTIPQLQDISRYLKKKTGFTLRPVAGLLSSRDFLAGLAHRVFHSTQYIRHGKDPFYTPEPDVCHELLGHVPLFANPSFAAFSQAIGMASLGASDEEVTRLATNYWFTVEFGICLEDGQKKAYGAGLLSSYGELEYCLSDKPEFQPYDPVMCGETKYPITTFQPLYFVANSFADAKRKIYNYSKQIEKPFSLAYDAFTNSVKVLDSKESMMELIEKTSSELGSLSEALSKM